MQKQGKGRKSFVIGIVAAVVILAAVLALLLTQCIGGHSGATTAPSTTAATDEVPTYELYWNVDRAEYDGKSEAGMSSRMPESDGYFHVRFILDGEEVILKVQDRKIINKIDVMDIMGLEFDENGIVVDAFDIKEMPLERIAWQFYVQSAGKTLIKANSSESFGGMEVQLELDGNSGVYDMTGKGGPLGCIANPMEGDRIYGIANLAGEITHVFIYERPNFMLTHEAECQHCEKTVTWSEWVRVDKLPVKSGHYQLQNDITLSGQMSMSEQDQKICLDLNGKRVDGKSGARVYSLHNAGSSLAIMDTSEGQTGVLAAHGKGDQGMVVWVRYGQLHLYGGTLDASDATTKLYGTTVQVPKNTYFYMHGGTLIGGTAAYMQNQETGAYSRGYGGTLHVAGKFVMNGGEIRDGFAQSVTYTKNGTKTTTRGYGGNVFASSGAEIELNGGVIKNGKAGSAGGNLYMDGTSTVTLDGTKIQGGVVTGSGKNGGSVYVTTKATLVMKSGSISGGSSYNAGGNVYINGIFTMSGGSIWGGKCYNYTTKKVNETSTSYNVFLVNGTFKMYGGRIYGGVAVTDTSATDNKTAFVGLTTYATIKSDAENTTNLTLNTGGKITCRVDTLRDSASIGINTARGLFTAPTLEANKDKFFSDVEGAEVIYTKDGLFLGRENCVCGKATHINGCDGTKYLWACWISGSTLPKTEGNFYLTKDVTTTSQSIVTKGDTVRLDLNGHNATYKVSATASDGYRLYRSAFQSLLVITDTTDKPGTLRSQMPTEAEVLAAVQANVEKGTYTEADAQKRIDGQKAGNSGQLIWARGGDVVLHNGILDGSNLKGTKNGMTVYVAANSASEDGGVNRGGNFTMYGGTIKGATSTSYGSSIACNSTSSVTIHGGVISGGVSTANAGGNVYVSGSFYMDGGVIRDGKAYSSGGNLTIDGSKAKAIITGNAQILNGQAGDPTLEKDIGRGGNIRVVTKGATLELSGNALVSGGKAYRSASNKGGYGGNISVNTDTTMTMTGGTVTGGVSQYRAGNIDVCGVLNMSGGIITGGEARYGGNIYVLNGNRELNITGGIIEKGHATSTGGNIQALAPVNITGGVIAEGKAALDSGDPSGNNSGGNIYACGVLNIGGEAVIRDGYSGGNGGNITLYVDGSLAGNATISGKAQILGGKCDGQLKDEFDGGYGGNIRANTGTTLTLKEDALISGGQAIGGKYVNGKGGGGQGGNLFMANATVNLLGGTVEKGTATGGGGNIGASAATGVLVLDDVIIRGGDTGTSYGGNIRVRGNGLGLLEIKGNTQILGGKANYGTGIALDGSNLTTVKVSGNAKIEGGVANLGGAVHILKNVDFTITDNAQIIGGKTVTGDGFGGAVYIGSSTDFAMTGKAQIVGGQAVAGGAVYMNDNVSFSMADDAVITGGNVGDSGNGPAVYINKNSTFTMTGNAIIDGSESVGKRGGAVYMNTSNSSFTMDGNAKLIGTKDAVVTNGGAGYLRGTVTIGGNAQIIPGSDTKYAGGIYFYTGTLTMKDNAVIDASATKSTNGTAIYLYQQTATLKVQDNAVIRGGEATGSGATIFVDAGGTVEITGGEIYGGKTTKSGGAIYTTGKVDLSGGTIYGSEVTGNGGAIYTTGKITMTGGTVNGGQAAYGGALYVYNGGSMTMSGGSIVGGEASKSGGAVAIEANASAATFTMTGGSISDGTAANSGGNLWVYGNKTDVKATATISATITDGVASKTSGGNIYIKNADVTMNGGEVKDGINGIDYTSSSDKPNGGNIYVGSGSVFTLNDGAVTGGKTINTGGNFIVYGDLVMNGGTVSGGAKINNAGEVTSTTSTNLNVYVVNANMTMTGGSIDGRVALYNKAKLTVSGAATMASADADAQELYLNGTTEPITISGTLTADRVAKVRFAAGTNQVFSGETTAENVARFTAYNASEDVFLNSASKLEVGKVQCICGFVGGKHIGDCDGTTYNWSAWTSTSTVPTTTGYYYLTSDVETTGSGVIKADDQKIALDLNGYTVYGTAGGSRVYTTYNSGTYQTGTQFTLINSGSTGKIQGWDKGGNGKTASENGGILWAASMNTTFNLYNITLDASQNKMAANKYGTVVSLTGNNSKLNVFNSALLGGTSDMGDAIALRLDRDNLTVRLWGDVTITGTEGSVLYMGGEGNILDVSELTSVNAPITVEGTGVFTQGWDEATLKAEDYFENVADDKAIDLFNSELALLPYHCICGMPEGKHVEDFCDEVKYIWQPWTSTTTVPNKTGHYYLTADVTANANTINTEQHIVVDLNGFNINSSKGRVYTTQYTTDRAVVVDFVLTNTKADDESIIKVTGGGDQGRIVWLSGYNKSLKVYNLTVDTTEANTNYHGAAFSINAQNDDQGAYIGIFNTVFNAATVETIGNGSVLSVTGGNKSEIELQDVTINGGSGFLADGTAGSSQNGGAIYLAYGELNMKNVTINGAESGAKGGAIYVGGTASVNMSGLISIEGKVDGKASGIYTNGGTIDVADLAAGSSIGISGIEGVISANEYASDDADLAYLSADNSEQYLAVRDGKLNLLGKECMCGMPNGNHVAGFCDKVLRAWQPWSGNKAPTATGNYYLTDHVTFSSTANMSQTDGNIVIDLNGFDITVPAAPSADHAGRMYTTYLAGGSTSNVNIVFTNRASDDSTIKVEGVGDQGRIVWMTGSNKSVSMYNVDIDLSTATTRDNVRKDGIAISVEGTGNVLDMYDCDITGGSTNSYGNVLRVDHGNSVTMTRCEVTDCESTDGNGGFAYVRGTMTLNNCTISNSSAKSYAGAIYLYGASETKRAKLIVNGGSFQNCSAANGGAINVQEWADIELSGVSFSGNSTTSNGGDIAVYDGCTADITDCTFENSSAGINGGVIYQQAGGETTVTDSSFKNTGAVDGGAILLGAGGSTMELTGCTFESCDATSNGGAIYVGTDNTLIVKNTNFTGCEAKHGGAIYDGTGASVEMTDCNITSCTANNYGGAVYLHSATEGSVAKLKMTGGTIDDCASTTSYGGAIVAGVADNSVTYTEVELTGTTIKNCSAKGRAGAIHISNGSSALLNGVTIDACTATSRAGAIYNYQGQLTIIDSTIKNCSATGSGSRGGGIYLYGTDITLGGKVEITDNTSSDPAHNIYLNGTKILISTEKALADDSVIGLSPAINTVPVISTQVTYGQKDLFVSDLDTLQIVHDGTNLKFVNASEHWHCVCGGQPTGDPDHKCKDIKFEAIDALSGGTKLESGNYYLTKEMTVSGSSYVQVADGKTVSLCLADHTLTGHNNSRLLYVSGTGELTVTSCDADGNSATVGTLVNASTSEGNVIGAYGTSVVNMYNITMDASGSVYTSTSYGNAINFKGTFNMYSGTIIGSNSTSNKTTTGAVAVSPGAVMNMYGGTIRDGSASDICGNVYVSGTLNMMGGTITGGKLGSTGTNSYQANVRVIGTGVLNMTGGTITGHVNAGVSGATVKLSGDAKILHEGNRGLWIVPGRTTLMIGDLTDKAQLNLIIKDSSDNDVFGVFAVAMDGYTITEQDVARITATNTSGAKNGNVVLNTDNTLSVEKLN